MVFMILLLVDSVSLMLGYIIADVKTITVLISSTILSIMFMVRAKQRGEEYVKGLFWSYI